MGLKLADPTYDLSLGKGGHALRVGLQWRQPAEPRQLAWVKRVVSALGEVAATGGFCGPACRPPSSHAKLVACEVADQVVEVEFAIESVDREFARAVLRICRYVHAHVGALSGVRLEIPRQWHIVDAPTRLLFEPLPFALEFSTSGSEVVVEVELNGPPSAVEVATVSRAWDAWLCLAALGAFNESPGPIEPARAVPSGVLEVVGSTLVWHIEDAVLGDEEFDPLINSLHTLHAHSGHIKSVAIW